MARPRKKHIFLRIISTLIWIAAMVALGMLTFEIYKAKIMPMKYYAILGGVALFLLIIVGQEYGYSYLMIYCF